jgi:hypothetical protein
MRDRVAELESSLASLSAEIAQLRTRLEALEAGAPAQTASDPLAAIPEVRVEQVQGWLAVLGRSLVILGGAYLLRAITASQVVSSTVGVGAGLLYGAPWLALAARAGARNRRLDAFAYGASTALIGYPLVWEATVRFGVLTGVQSAVLLGALTAAAFVLSAAWRLHSLAAIVTCGALVSAAGLGYQTQQWLPYTTLAIAVGLATVWLGYLRNWVLLRWPAALVADVMIVVLTGLPRGRFWSILLVQLVAIGAYGASFAVRTIWSRRRVIPFEVAQSLGILSLVVPSVFTLAAPHHAGTASAAAVMLFTGIVTYLVAFTVVERDTPSANVYFYSLVAAVLVTAGSTIAIPLGAPLLLGAAGAAAAVIARRRTPIAFSVQATLLTAAALAASGAIANATAGLTAPRELWTPIPPGAWAALACAIAAFAAAPRRPERFGAAVTVSRLLLAVIVVWSAGGVLVRLVGGSVSDPAWLATLRTVISVSAALAIASRSRRDAWREAAWLTYPLLVVLGLKLLVSDFPSGRPVTLFIALAAYGIALIAAPRALRHATIRQA